MSSNETTSIEKYDCNVEISYPFRQQIGRNLSFRIYSEIDNITNTNIFDSCNNTYFIALKIEYIENYTYG